MMRSSRSQRGEALNVTENIQEKRTMANDLDRVKARLLEQFNDACNIAEATWIGDAERAANRNAAGTIGFAIVAIEKEMRERAENSALAKPVLRCNNQ